METTGAITNLYIGRPWRILLFGSQMETGGAQRILLEQGLWFHQHGYQVTAAFLYDKEGLHTRWRELYPFPIVDVHARQINASKAANAFYLVAGLIRAYRMMRGNKFDIIETFTHHPNMMILPLAWLASVPVRIGTHHGMFHGFGKSLIWLHSRIINSKAVNALIAVSENVRQQAISEGIKAEKISVIPNGVRLPQFDKISAREKIRSSLEIDEIEPVFLTVGRLQVEKGHDLLIQAIPGILTGEPRAKFLFAGDGILKGALAAQAFSLGVSDRIMFLGFRDDIPELMAASDLLIMPSRTEGMPNVLLEAMGLGLPVVAFNVGGIGEAVINGLTGQLINPYDINSMVNWVLSLARNKTLLLKMAASSRERFLLEFTMDMMCEGYLDLFEREGLS